MGVGRWVRASIYGGVEVAIPSVRQAARNVGAVGVDLGLGKGR